MHYSTRPKVTASEYSFVMPSSEVMVIPIFIQGGAGKSGNTDSTITVSSSLDAGAPPSSSSNSLTTSSAILSDGSNPIVVQGDSERISDNSSSATTTAIAEDPATVDIANQTSTTVVVPTKENSVTGNSDESNSSSNSSSDSSMAVSKGNTASNITSSGKNPIMSTVDTSEISNSITVSSESSENGVIYDGISDGGIPSNAIVVPSGSDNETLGTVTYDGISGADIPSNAIIVPSGNNSEISGTLIAPNNGSGIVSSTIVIPSQNGEAVSDTLPIGNVVVPSSSAPAMVLPDSSGGATSQEVKVVSSIKSAGQVTSAITNVTRVPNILSVIGTPTLVSSIVDGKKVSENGVPAAKIFSAYVPIVLPIETSMDGVVVVPTNAKIISNEKQGNICVDSVAVRYAAGWQPINGSDTSGNNSLNQISVSLRQNATDQYGQMKLTKNNWIIRPKKNISLNMDATLSDEILLSETPVALEFVLDWAK